MRALLALLLVAGCMDEDPEIAECRCVEYNVVADRGFDRITVTWDFEQPRTANVNEYATDPTNHYLASYADPFWGPARLVATAYDANGLIGSGAVNLEYTHVGDSEYWARGTLTLTPP